ncbi:pre-16S rRNA-processing nuclease YqgF [bacterium]|nr:pre-16S rRNA-processing nuclease YqgF [bacterium]NCQ55251.1 pre-16S rRNA-processing nuclease YqgF [Candidatus Parcubacteria bacterium]NCS67236.1 pre-16S rRNA-processing nuclease YqgF [Candidatus Peregrinibacteria bacterium]NCS96491.1 pre-16S rRNA-processing nuclease YqgF [bacterium]
MAKKISAKALFDLSVRHEHHKSDKSLSKEAILALDYGEKFCGFAIAPDGQTVLPAAVVRRAELESALESLVTTYAVKRLVIGLPLSSDGSENHICSQIQTLAQRLRKVFVNIKIELVNERFSSQTVLSPDNDRIDDLAAMQILEYYIAGAKS